METSKNIIKFEWLGDEKGKDGSELIVTVGGISSEPFAYNEACEFEFPIDSETTEITVGYRQNQEAQTNTRIKHSFIFVPGKDYSAILSGKVTNFSGFGLQVVPEDEDVENAPKARNNIPVAFLSFLFPIYGIINAIRSNYNRKAAIYGAVIGFVLAMSFSLMIEDGDKIGFGIGHSAIFEYEPFTLLDFVINLLVGGISTLRGLLYLLLESLV